MGNKKETSWESESMRILLLKYQAKVWALYLLLAHKPVFFMSHVLRRLNSRDNGLSFDIYY